MTRVWPGQPGRLAELPLAGATRRHGRRVTSPATWPPGPRHPVPGWAVVSAGLAPVLATAGWLVADALQPASYSPIRKTISVMAGYAGTDRWVMTGALLLVGGCQLVAAAGLAGLRCRPASCSPSRACPASASPYRPSPFGARLRSISPGLHSARPPSRSGLPSSPGARARPRPLILSSYGCAVVTAVFMALLGWLVIETQGGSDLGLAERLFLSIETCWPFVVAITLRQTTD